MNCVECRELLVGYIEELLDAGQNQAVEVASGYMRRVPQRT